MKPILFIDFDGTLCHDKFWRTIDSNCYEQIQDFLFSENKSIIQDWMKGFYSSEDINILISKMLNIPFEQTWEVFINDCKNMTISIDTLNQIKKFGKKFETILITDNMDCFTRFTVPAKKLNSFFDSIVNSFENKKLKAQNKGEVFIQLSSQRNTKIEDCILIDNSKIVCDLFSKLGGKSYLVTADAPLEFWLKNLEKEFVSTESLKELK
jgi:FMN phosphatase YigB (HAD superfamily)